MRVAATLAIAAIAFAGAAFLLVVLTSDDDEDAIPVGELRRRGQGATYTATYGIADEPSGPYRSMYIEYRDGEKRRKDEIDPSTGSVRAISIFSGRLFGGEITCYPMRARPSCSQPEGIWVERVRPVLGRDLDASAPPLDLPPESKNEIRATPEIASFGRVIIGNRAYCTRESGDTVVETCYSREGILLYSSEFGVTQIMELKRSVPDGIFDPPYPIDTPTPE